jgi:integrase
MRLFRQVPARYQAAVRRGAGQGLRIGEAPGMEVGDRCLDRAAGELYVVPQLQWRLLPDHAECGLLRDRRPGPGRRGPPRRGGFHALRHFFATTLITNHSEPREVQRLLRHRTLRYTLETYVGWWPKRDRRRGLVGTLLEAAGKQPAQP